MAPQWPNGRIATAASSRPVTGASKSLSDFVEASRLEWRSTRQHAKAVADAGKGVSANAQWAVNRRGGVSAGLGLLDEAPAFPRRSVSENYDRVRPGGTEDKRQLSSGGAMGYAGGNAEGGKRLGEIGAGLRRRVRDMTEEARAEKMEEERKFLLFIKMHTGRTRISQRKKEELRSEYVKHLHQERKKNALDSGTLFDIQKRMEEEQWDSSDEDIPPPGMVDDPFGEDADPFPIGVSAPQAKSALLSLPRGGGKDLPSRGQKDKK
ncbi:hypothetical protein T484DRAFT_1767888, partial [Baffinella frigidus]